MPNIEGSKVARSLLSIVIMVLVVFGLSRLLNTFVFGAYEIPSGSMEDTIEVGDTSSRRSFPITRASPKRGHRHVRRSACLQPHADPERVIATGGQTVDLQNGRNVCRRCRARRAPTPRTRFPSRSKDNRFRKLSTRAEGLPLGHGHRTNSQDSRYLRNRRLERDRSWVFTYWPIPHIGVLS